MASLAAAFPQVIMEIDMLKITQLRAKVGTIANRWKLGGV
jgi:hypothetical protein